MECLGSALLAAKPTCRKFDYCQSCELPLGVVCPNYGALAPHGASSCVACGTSFEEASPPTGLHLDNSSPPPAPGTPHHPRYNPA